MTELKPISDIEGNIHVDALCVVHATRYMPIVRDDGGMEIQTTATGTDNTVFRNSIHFSVNHRVASHGYGNWQDKAFTVISGLQDVANANGSPYSFMSDDTWWVRGLNENLVLPNATIVMPDEEQQALVLFESGRTTYKTDAYTVGEVLEVMRGWPGDAGRLALVLESAIMDYRRDNEALVFEGNFEQFANDILNAEHSTLLRDVLPDGWTQQEADLFVTHVRNTVNQYAVDHTLNDLGYKIIGGQSFGVQERESVTDQIGGDSLSHFGSSGHQLEKAMNMMLYIIHAVENQTLPDDYLHREVEDHQRGFGDYIQFEPNSQFLTFQAVMDGSYIDDEILPHLQAIEDGGRTQECVNFYLTRARETLQQFAEEQAAGTLWTDERIELLDTERQEQVKARMQEMMAEQQESNARFREMLANRRRTSVTDVSDDSTDGPPRVPIFGPRAAMRRRALFRDSDESTPADNALIDTAGDTARNHGEDQGSGWGRGGSNRTSGSQGTS